jgi:hypothetical protein
VRHAPPAAGVADELEPLAHLLAREDVEEPELDDDPSPPTATAPVMSACALIARQSWKATGASKLVTVEMKDPGAISRNSPVPTRFAATTRVMSRAYCAASAVSAWNSGIAKGRGSITPSVISIRSGPCCASAVTARRPNSAAARTLHPII